MLFLPGNSSYDVPVVVTSLFRADAEGGTTRRRKRRTGAKAS
jgi:hypothetical protein